VSSGTSSGQLHTALLYDSAAELVAAAVPFLADGLAAGEAALLACREEDNALLARALADDRLLQVSREEIYTGSAHALATYRRLVHRQVATGASRIRLVCAVPVDQRPQQWNEWHRYEAIFNVAMDPMPVSSVCAYDRRAISDEIRHGVMETHPALLTPAGPALNDRYLEPATVLRRSPAHPADAVPEEPPVLVLTDVADASRLPELRARLRIALDGGTGHRPQRGRFAAAVTEVLGNAFRHGAPPVTVRLWRTPTRLECTITDGGQGFDDPLAGYTEPGHGAPPARAGLWMARQACDTLETFPTPSGFTVRLTTTLPGPDTTPKPSSSGPAADLPAARADRARAEARELARKLGAQSQP
jgi:anti-sigma regulatory factor (Ser/Thr protein kinase)